MSRNPVWMIDAYWRRSFVLAACAFVGWTFLGHVYAQQKGPAVTLEEEEEGPAPKPKQETKEPAKRPDKPEPAKRPEKTTRKEVPKGGAIEPGVGPIVCDVLIAAYGGRGESMARNIRLQPTKLPATFSAGETYQFDFVTGEGKGFTPVKLLGKNITRARYYEQVVLEAAAKELGFEPDKLAGVNVRVDVNAASIAEGLSAAIGILQTGIAEHDSAIARQSRIGREWADYRQDLVQALFNLEISVAENHLRESRFQQALEISDRLAAQTDLGTENRKAVRLIFEKVLLDGAEQNFASGNFEECRKSLADFLARYPNAIGQRATDLRKGLIETAKDLAVRAAKENDPRLFDQAELVWPQLDGLDEMRRKVQNAYPIMRVGYATLPTNFSPLTARTTVDRHALSLLFESLVRWRDDSTTGARYVTQLASTRPQSVPRGREFQLPKCAWSDSTIDSPHLCTAEDVRWTVQLLKSTRPFGFSSAWQRLVADVDPASGDNPFRVAITLKQDHWQPFSLMDFMVVPKASFPKGGTADELDAFATNPVGTGPYRLALSQDARVVRFVANPLYRTVGLPKIREITFNQLEALEAQDEFRKGNLQLLYGVRPEQVVQLRGQGKSVVKIPGRNVHFLAPNHRHPKLKNENLRRAIAHAIDRPTILNTYFRPGKAEGDHAVLNGPFPAKSWANNTSIPAYAPNSAAAFLAKAREALGNDPIQLQLIYPNADPEVAQACDLIRKQLADIGIQLTTKGIDPDQFIDTVIHPERLPRSGPTNAIPKGTVGDHTFELAYWRHDFDDETLWLWPLFDPSDRANGGSNFMGIVPDELLTGLFRDMSSHKQFRTIQEAAFKIHEYVYRNAPFIPLWELDAYVAVGDSVKNPSFDPVFLYRDIESWYLTRR